MQEGLKDLKGALSAFSWKSAEAKYEKFRRDQKSATAAKAADARINALPGRVTSREAAKQILNEKQNFATLPKEVRALCQSEKRLSSLCEEAERFILCADKSEAEALDLRFSDLLSEKNSTVRCDAIEALHASVASLDTKIRNGAKHFEKFLALYRTLPTLREAARIDDEIRALNTKPLSDTQAQGVLAYKKKFDALSEAIRKAATEVQTLQTLVQSANAQIQNTRESAAQAIDQSLASLLSEPNTETRCDRIKSTKEKLASTEASVRALLKNGAAFDALYKKLPALREAAAADTALQRASLAPKNEKWANETLALLERLENMHAAVAAECERLSLITVLRKEAQIALTKAKLDRYKVQIESLILKAKIQNTLESHDALIEAYEKRTLTKEEEQMAAGFCTTFRASYENSKKATALLLAKEAEPYLNAMATPANFVNIEKLDAEKGAHTRALLTVEGFSQKWKLAIEASVRLAEENGKRLFESQKFSDALSPLAYAAKHGKGRAALLCAGIYEKGLGGKVSAEAAFRYYTEADASGEIEAAYHIGDLYLRGFGAKKDPAAALRYLEKAAAKKYTPALSRMGELYLDGTAVRADHAKALSYLKAAAAQKDAAAEYNLGRMLEEGLGTAADLEGALRLYGSAARSVAGAKLRYEALKQRFDDQEALDKELTALTAMQNSLSRVERMEEAKRRYDALAPALAARCKGYEGFAKVYDRIFSYRVAAKLDALYETAVQHRGTPDFIKHAEVFFKNFYAHRSGTTQMCLVANKVDALKNELQNAKNSSLLDYAKSVYSNHSRIPAASMSLSACKTAINETEEILKDEALLTSMDAAFCQSCKALLASLKKRQRAIYSEEALPYISAMNNPSDYTRILSLASEISAHREALHAIEPSFDTKWQDALSTAQRLQQAELARIAAARARAEQEKHDAKDREINDCYQLAMRGDANAQYRLACYYLYGDGVTRDYKMAVEFFEKAAHRGSKDAMEMLGDCYKHGWGVPISLGKAEKWYKKALK